MVRKGLGSASPLRSSEQTDTMIDGKEVFETTPCRIFHFPTEPPPNLTKCRQFCRFLNYVTSFPGFGRGLDSHRPSRSTQTFTVPLYACAAARHAPLLTGA